MTNNEQLKNETPEAVVEKPEFIEPELIKAGDDRIRLGMFREAPLVDCRVISDDGYQYLISKIQSLQKENEELKNDILDALDLKEGKGPTALTNLSNKISDLEAQLVKARECLLKLMPRLIDRGMYGSAKEIESFLSTNEVKE